MLGRPIIAIWLSASTALAQGVSGEVQSVPYELMQSFATEQVDFEEFDEWRGIAVLITQNIHLGPVNFGNIFAGQYVNGQITGKKVDLPLSLAQNPDRMPPVQLDELGGTIFSSGSDITSVVPAARDAFMSMALLGHAIDQNNVISQSDWRYNPRYGGALTQTQVIGISPVSILFEQDQFAVGFRVIRLNRSAQLRRVSQQTGQPRFRVKFFRRDGVLISEVILTPDRDRYVAFARCGQAADIAGIQITNSTKSGLAYDDFIFGVPVGQEAENGDETRNPLEIQLCSIFTS